MQSRFPASFFIAGDHVAEMFTHTSANRQRDLMAKLLKYDTSLFIQDSALRLRH